MKKFRKVFSLLICAITILTLISCGVNNSSTQSMMLRTETTAAAMYTGAGFGRANAKMAAVNDIAVEEMTFDGAKYTTADSSGSTSDRKIIKTVDLNTETKTFDESIEWLKSYVASFDGIIDSSYVDSGNINDKNYRKNANFNVRIPAIKLDSFLSKIGDKLNVTFRQENISDITDEYSDTESRLKSLKIEEESLNAMLKKAKTVEEMIKVEDKLSSVRTEIENITRRLNRYDKQVTYSTVHINISEVKDLTEPQVSEDDFSKETLIKQLKKNLTEAKLFVMRLGANIFTHIPGIILGLVAILLIVIISAIFKALFGKKNEIELDNSIVKSSENEKIKSDDKDRAKEDEVEVEFYQEEKK